MTIALLITIIGLLFYLLMPDTYVAGERVARIGEIMFAIGLVFVLIAVGGKAVGL